MSERSTKPGRGRAGGVRLAAGLAGSLLVGLLMSSSAATAQKNPYRNYTEDKFVENMQSRLKGTVWASGCKSWYVNDSGKNTTLWPGFTFDYRRETAHFDLENYRVQQKAWSTSEASQGVAA